MTEQDLQAQKRQRMQTEQDESKEKEQEQDESEQSIERIEQSTKCRISKTVDGVLCSIFTFLNLRDHCNLSRSYTKMQKISLQPQASPVFVNLSNLIVTDTNSTTTTTSTTTWTEEAKTKILKRVMAFRLLRLIMPIDDSVKLAEVGKMTSLRELAIGNLSGGVNELFPDIEWISKLINLLKLTIPDKCLLASTVVPSSLTYLEFLKTGDGGFTHFDSTALFANTSITKLQGLQQLQILKFPNNYCGPEVLEVGKLFSALRELSIGYFYARDHRMRIDFAKLESCKHLESFTVGLDPDEGIPQWETLSAITSLRRLTVSIYQSQNATNLFAGLSQVTQLTHLKLTPHRNSTGFAFYPTFNLFAPPLTALPSLSVAKESNAVLPNLTSLTISDGLGLQDAKSLSVLGALEELKLPNDKESLINLPRLHTLHVVKGQVGLLNYYKDQLTTVFYKDSEGYVDRVTHLALDVLCRMKQLVTLKLDPNCNVWREDRFTSGASTSTSVAKFFRMHLPSTVNIETDYSMQ